jgi:hypothetical protein
LSQWKWGLAEFQEQVKTKNENLIAALKDRQPNSKITTALTTPIVVKTARIIKCLDNYKRMVLTLPCFLQI